MKLGFLGTGLMGQPLVQRLLEAKLPVIAYNRTAAKLQSLREAGAIIADSPAVAIRASDGVISTEVAIFSYFLSLLALWERGRWSLPLS